LKQLYADAVQRREKTEKEFEEQFQRQRSALTQNKIEYESKNDELTQQQEPMEIELNGFVFSIEQYRQGMFSEDEQSRIAAAVGVAVATLEKQLKDHQAEKERTETEMDEVVQRQTEYAEKIKSLTVINEQFISRQLP
jgi:chromosome segregation ATPase